jgi:hypothetical protein
MRLRISSAFTIAAVASVLYSVYSIAGPGTPTDTSSSPCVPASVAVDIYAQTFPGWVYGLNNSFTGAELEEKCTDVCKKWKGTCKGVAKDGQKCVNSYASKSFGVFEEVCKTEPDDDIRKNCTGELKSELKSLKNQTKFDGKQAKACCEEFLERCVISCIVGNSTPFIEPTCSGLPPLSDLESCA